MCIFRGEASEVNNLIFLLPRSNHHDALSLSTRYWPARAPSADPTQAPHAARSSTSSSAAARSQSSAGIGGRTRVSDAPSPPQPPARRAAHAPARAAFADAVIPAPPSHMCSQAPGSQSAQGTTTTGYSSLQGLFSGLYQLLPPPLHAPPSPPHPCLHQEAAVEEVAAARRPRLSCTPPHATTSVEAPQRRQVEAVRRRRRKRR